MARKRNVATEGKIAAAATKLFCAQGYLDTTMAAIAAEAGVSVQTLYLRHGSKAAILSAALDVAIVGDADPVPVADREGEFFARALGVHSAAESIAIWARGVRNVCARTHGLYEVIRSAAADPEVAEVLAKNRHERSAGHLVLAAAFADKDGFAGRSAAASRRPAVRARTEDSYLLFVVDRGWTPEEWERWVVDTLGAQLLVPSATSRRRRP